MRRLKKLVTLIPGILLLAMLIFTGKALADDPATIYIPSDNAGIDPCELGECGQYGYEITKEDRRVDFNDSFGELKKYDPKAPEFLISKDTSIYELKGALVRFKDYLVNIDKNLTESNINITKAQDIILRARATGNKKAGEIAEDALKKAQETKEKLLKQKGLVDLIIQKIEAILAGADRGNYKNLLELCEARKKQLERDEEQLKKAMADVERVNKEREDRLKEIEEECESFFINMTTNVIPTLIANSKSIGISEGTKEKLESFAHLAGLFSDEMKAQDIYYESQDLKRREKQWENIVTSQEELVKELQDAKKQLTEEKKNIGLISSVDLFLALAEKTPSVKMLEMMKAGSDLVEHSVKISFLNDEVERDYKLTDEQLKAMNALIKQHKRSFQKVKECKEMMGER
ncbi:hypothetical protein [Thermodesulfovibrio thiophilus]|uniref:hypothetical protein n=1 Tax=Thermodesulfovibrio thiophilus TaxID=340095 RepID=UPI001802C7CC|nr:hypothetical protein [Thermodesulfovibrio thiophilus]HHW20394.1 hypothetical protein [Thermodesulfovibrio thiophilus]